MLEIYTLFKKATPGCFEVRMATFATWRVPLFALACLTWLVWAV